MLGGCARGGGVPWVASLHLEGLLGHEGDLVQPQGGRWGHGALLSRSPSHLNLPPHWPRPCCCCWWCWCSGGGRRGRG